MNGITCACLSLSTTQSVTGVFIFVCVGVTRVLHSITVIRGCGLNLHFICLALICVFFLLQSFLCYLSCSESVYIASVAAAFIFSYPLFLYSRTFIA